MDCKDNFPNGAHFCKTAKSAKDISRSYGQSNHYDSEGGETVTIAFVRTIILYALLIVGIRMMGKRQVGELEPTELVLAMLLSDLAAVPMQDFGLPLLYGVVPIITLLCLTMILSVVTMRSIRLRSLLCGKPSIVVQEGKLRQEELRKVRMTVDELIEELRLQGVTDISTVKYAILETSGQLSVLLFENQQPVTPYQLGLHPPMQELPIVVISDGRLMEENLKWLGLDRTWLDKQLHSLKLNSPKEVFLLTVDRKGAIYCSPKERKK